MLQSDYAKGKAVAPTPASAGEMCSYRAIFDIKAAETSKDQIVEMGPLPAGCALVDVLLTSTKLDTHATVPTITIDAGLMSGEFGEVDAERTCGSEVFAASIVAQAGGLVRPTLATALAIAPSASDRGIGVKFKNAAAVGAAGSIGLTVIYRG